MRLRRFVAFFLVFVLMTNLISVRAFASSVDDDWNWSDSVNDYVLVPFSDLVSDAIVSVDNVFDTMGDVISQNFKDTLDFWSGLFSVDSSQSYDDYIEALEDEYGAVKFDEYGYLYWRPAFSDLSDWCVYTIINGYGFSVYKGDASSITTSHNVHLTYSIGDTGNFNYSSTSNSYLSFKVFEINQGYFVAPISGSYTSMQAVIDGKLVSLYIPISNRFYNEGDTVGFYLSLLDPAPSALSHNFVVSPPQFRILPASGAVFLDASSRPSSFFSIVSYYNSPDNSSNYFIGSLDEDGEVSEIYDPSLFDEDTLVFTEPVTGAQYQTTGWIFDYNTRTYQLSLEPGTFLIGEADIDRIDLAYGDDVLTISYYADGALIQTDTYAYVTATKKDPSTCQHSYTSEITTAATCTAPGVRTYTCSLCGDTYTEEIPQLDHVYTYETVTPPTCIDPGERKGVCSVCGAEVVEDLESLGHDWQPSSSTQTTYALPEDAACPDCGSTSFDSVLSQGSGTYDCTCSSCGTEWIEQAVITYGQTTYTCSRCGETYVESQDADSGLFAAIGDFIADGIGWIVDKLKQLIDSLSGINDIFSDFIEDIKSKSGQYPAFLGAVIAVLPEDFMTVIWFSIIAGIVLAVWKLWFR